MFATTDFQITGTDLTALNFLASSAGTASVVVKALPPRPQQAVRAPRRSFRGVHKRGEYR